MQPTFFTVKPYGGWLWLWNIIHGFFCIEWVFVFIFLLRSPNLNNEYSFLREMFYCLTVEMDLEVDEWVPSSLSEVLKI